MSARATAAALTAALLLLSASPSLAATASGPEVGWTRLADQVLLSAEALGGIVPIIALMMLGVGLLTQLNLGPVVNTVIGASLLVLGSGLAASLLGATP